MSEIAIHIEVPEGSGLTLYTDCPGCALHFVCPHGYMGNSFCNHFDFAKAKVKIMKGEKAKKNTDVPSDEDIAWINDMLYTARTLNLVKKVRRKNGTYIFQPVTQSDEQIKREKHINDLSKDEIKAELRRLRDRLRELGDEGGKQLNLLEEFF